MELAAIVLGPVIAVIITLWHQDRSQKYQRRFDTFKTLVIYRRHGMSVDFVNALNLVPVIFYKENNVIAARRKLMECFDDNEWSSDEPDVRRRLLERTETRVAELIREIGKSIKVPIDDIEVLKGVYAPTGWASVEEMTHRSRLAALELLEGRRPLPVVVAAPAPQADPLQGAQQSPLVQEIARSLSERPEASS